MRKIKLKGIQAGLPMRAVLETDLSGLQSKITAQDDPQAPPGSDETILVFWKIETVCPLVLIG
jgi:hypothetical protein